MGGGGGQVVGQPSNPLKAQIVGLLHAVQYLKPVVIIANGITILFELVRWKLRRKKRKNDISATFVITNFFSKITLLLFE